MFAMTVELNPGQNVLASTPMIKKLEGYHFKIMVYKVFFIYVYNIYRDPGLFDHLGHSGSQ